MVIEKSFAVFWSKNATKNLKDVNEYIKQDSPQNASKVTKEIIELSKSLNHSPFRFEECEELKTKTKIYRKATYAPFKIIYKVKANRVEVLAVFHSSQNPKRLKALRKIKIR